MTGQQSSRFRRSHLHGLAGPRGESTPEERSSFIGPVELPDEKDHPRKDVRVNHPDTNDYYAEMASYS